MERDFIASFGANFSVFLVKSSRNKAASGPTALNAEESCPGAQESRGNSFLWDVSQNWLQTGEGISAMSSAMSYSNKLTMVFTVAPHPHTHLPHHGWLPHHPHPHLSSTEQTGNRRS
jgi:hypothetical protein